METRALLPSWLPAANRLVKALQRLGLPLGTIHVLTVPGRVSGRPRATPVSPLTVDGKLCVIAGLAQSDWARNARAAGHGELARGRRRQAVELREVTDPQRRRAVARAFPTQVPHGVFFFERLGLVQGPHPEEFAAAADRMAVFEITAHTADQPRVTSERAKKARLAGRSASRRMK